VAVARGSSALPATNPNSYAELVSPFTTTSYSFVTNTSTPVDARGWGLSAEYQAGKGYVVSGNVSGDQIYNVPANVVTFFNTPKLRFNVSLANNNFYKNWGFNIIYRWQDAINWEGTFGTGEIPSFGVVDAQVNYRFPNTKNMLKIGGTNIFNNYYRSAFGNPQIGGLYYVSFGYNVF
ncbi:MAG: TonB-dependent receptor, partial [Chitinophagaceae bacterium]